METRLLSLRLKRVVTLLLALVAMAAGHSAWAASSFKVTNTTGTSKFVITRTPLPLIGNATTTIPDGFDLPSAQN